MAKFLLKDGEKRGGSDVLLLPSLISGFKVGAGNHVYSLSWVCMNKLSPELMNPY